MHSGYKGQYVKEVMQFHSFFERGERHRLPTITNRSQWKS